MAIRVFTSFAEVPPEIRLQLAHPSQSNFFLSFDWFQLLFETSLHTTLNPRIYVRFDGPRPLCALFCGVDRQGSDRRLMSLGNFYTLEYLPSFPQGAVPAQALVAELVEHLAKERPRWNGLRFNMLWADARETAWMLDALGSTGFGAHPFFQYENWYLRTEGENFETYFAKRPSQLRNTIGRRQKKLEKAHKFHIILVRDESPQLETAIRDFVGIYGSSWKEAEPFPDFIPALATRCAQLGILRLGILYVDAKPAAAQLWITTAGKAIIYKLAYDEQYAELGVGSILSKELFRVAIDEDRVDEIDYGVGSENYKKDWMASVRTLQGIEAYNRRSATGLLLSLAADTKRLAKRVRASLAGNRP